MMKTEAFGVLSSGHAINQYSLTNETGTTVRILNYGGIIRELLTPDREGVPGNIVLSYETLADYEANPAFIGAVIGRTAGRIGGGELVIGNSRYTLPQNNGENTLHGGPCGFHTKPMKGELAETPEAMSLSLSFESEAGECGYPGKLSLELRYTLMKRENVLILDFVGVSDQKTYLNMTHHGYFNLSGGARTIEEHVIRLSADAYAPVDSAMLPQTGWTPVAGTPFDLRQPVPLGEVIHREDAQIRLARGIDHPFRLLPQVDQGAESPCALLTDPQSGRGLTVGTTHPHLVVYTGNFLDAAEVPSGKRFNRYQGICFEAQEVPNAPGNPAFQCSYLEAGEPYRHTLRYAFTVEPN